MLGCSLSQYHQLDAHSCENGLYRFHVFSPCHVQIPRGRQSCRTQVLLSEHLAERTKSREQAAQYLGFANSEKVQGRDVGDNSQPWDVDIQGCLCCTLGWGKGKWSVTNHLFQSNGSNFCWKPWFGRSFISRNKHLPNKKNQIGSCQTREMHQSVQ